MAVPTRRRSTAPQPDERAVLRISSRNYSSWSMRGWLLCRMAGLDFEEEVVSPDDPTSRAELLLQSSSILIPSLRHEGAELWDTLAIAEYLNELKPEARMLPEERIARARCRAISGEMHAGFAALRSTLPMNLRAFVPNFTLWSVADLRGGRAVMSKSFDDEHQRCMRRPCRCRPEGADWLRSPMASTSGPTIGSSASPGRRTECSRWSPSNAVLGRTRR